MSQQTATAIAAVHPKVTARDRSRSPPSPTRSRSRSRSRDRVRFPLHEFVNVKNHACSNDRKCQYPMAKVVCTDCLYCYHCCILAGECESLLIKPLRFEKDTAVLSVPIPFSTTFPVSSSQIIGEWVVSDHGGYILTCPQSELSLFRDAQICGMYCNKIATSAMKSKGRPEGLTHCHWAWDRVSKKHIWVGDQQPWYFTHSYFEYKQRIYEHVPGEMFSPELCAKGLLPSVEALTALDLLTTILKDSPQLLTAQQKAAVQKTLDSLESPSPSLSLAQPSPSSSLPPLEVVIEKTTSVTNDATCIECRELSASKCAKCGRCDTCCCDMHGGTCWTCKRLLPNAQADTCFVKGCECQKCELCCPVLAKSESYREYKKIQEDMQRKPSGGLSQLFS